jgi:hypothetical protein
VIALVAIASHQGRNGVAFGDRLLDLLVGILATATKIGKRVIKRWKFDIQC